LPSAVGNVQEISAVTPQLPTITIHQNMLTINVQVFIITLTVYMCRWYGGGAGNTTEENSSLLPNPNALVAISNGMRAAKLCFKSDGLS